MPAILRMPFPQTVVPGVALSAAVALGAFGIDRAQAALLGRNWFDTLVVAILAGSLIRTLWRPPERYGAGLTFSAKTLLEIGVVLLGATTSATAIYAAGLPMLLAIVTVVAISIPASYALGRLLGLEPKLATLIACGNSICGNSAIAAVAPVIGAKGEDVAASVGFTAVLGILTVLLLPVLAAAMGFSDARFGILAGLTVYAVPQVVAATSAASLVALHTGTIVKLTRVLMLGPVCVLAALVNRGGAGKGPRLGEMVPWFIVGFVGLMVARTAGVVPDGVSEASAVGAHALTAVSMAALGLGVDLRALRKAGGPASLAAGGSLLLLAGLAIVAILLVG